MMEPPLFISGSALCTVKNTRLRALMSNSLSKCSSVTSGVGRGSATARVGKHDIELAALRLHFPVQPVEILRFRHIRADGRHVASDFGRGLIELGLAPARNINVRALFDEPLGRGQADSAAAVR